MQKQESWEELDDYVRGDYRDKSCTRHLSRLDEEGQGEAWFALGIVGFIALILFAVWIGRSL